MARRDPPPSPYLRPSPVAFAHRGGAVLWPENTMVAFQGAVDLGYQYIETDLRVTRDGVIVCFHDPTLDRTTDGAGHLTDLSFDELMALDAGYRFTPDGGKTYPWRGRGVQVPTLEEALEIHPNLRLNIEIKQGEPAMEQALWDELDRLDAHDRVLVAAEHDAYVHRFRSLRARRLPTSAGVRAGARFFLGLHTGLHRFEQYPYDALQVPPSWRGLRIVTPALVEVAHAHGLAVHVWTIDDPEEMRRLLDLGVDGIMTDRPDLLRDVFRERGLRLGEDAMGDGYDAPPDDLQPS